MHFVHSLVYPRNLRLQVLELGIVNVAHARAVCLLTYRLLVTFDILLQRGCTSMSLPRSSRLQSMMGLICYTVRLISRGGRGLFNGVNRLTLKMKFWCILRCFREWRHDCLLHNSYKTYRTHQLSQYFSGLPNHDLLNCWNGGVFWCTIRSQLLSTIVTACTAWLYHHTVTYPCYPSLSV